MTQPTGLHLIAVLFLAAPALASTASLLDGYRGQAQTESKAFTGFSEDRGRAFYNQAHATPDGKTTSCATCHGTDPKAPGRNRLNKVLLPLAPVANKERLQDATTVEKWFTRNCQDVLQRSCTAQEKGDFITYLQSVK